MAKPTLRRRILLVLALLAIGLLTASAVAFADCAHPDRAPSLAELQ